MKGDLNTDPKLSELQQYNNGQPIPYSVVGIHFPTQGVIGVRVDGPHPLETMWHEIGHVTGISDEILARKFGRKLASK